MGLLRKRFEDFDPEDPEELFAAVDAWTPEKEEWLWNAVVAALSTTEVRETKRLANALRDVLMQLPTKHHNPENRL